MNNIFMRYRKESVMVLVAVVIIVVILLVGRSSDSSMENVTEDTSSTMETAADGSTSTTATPTISYTQAVNQYKDRRIQFDANCVMFPNPASLRNNTVMMLDNRSPNPRSVYIDRTKYNLSGYGFKFVALRFGNLPHTAVIDCGTGRNTGTLLVQ